MTDGDSGRAAAAIQRAQDDLRAAVVERVERSRGSDRDLRRAVDRWAEREGHAHLSADDRTAVVAAQYAALAVNAAAWRARAVDAPSSPPAPDDLFAAPAPDDLFAALRDAPFTPPLPTVFDRIPSSTTTRSITARLWRALTTGPAVPPDEIGARYEAAVPAAARGAAGQFYTPPAVAAALVEWTLAAAADRPPRVLDPAAGTGAFLVAAARRLRDRRPDRRGTLGRLVGVDRDPVALCLAGLALAARGVDPTVAEIDLRAASFFDLEPGPEPDADRTLDRVDAVVGNPPYIRAENLRPDAEHFRRHLRALGADGRTPYADGDRRIGKRADAYVYFVTHATRFLRDGGRLGVVVPSKWLASRYGEAFQRFLFDHYRVHAIVGFAGRTFPDALVDAALLLCERRVDRAPRSANPVRFVRLADSLDVDDLLRTVDASVDAPDGAGVTVARDDGARTVAVDQAALAAAGPGKLAPYLAAPRELLALLDHPGFVPLGELADVSRGVMTGANRFFFVDRDEAAALDIDSQFLRPALKSVRGVETRALGPDDVERYLIDVHDYVEATASDGADDPAAAVERALARDGHDGLVAYVRRAEADGWHEGRTCRRRRVWFDLGRLSAPDAFVPKLLRERVFAIRNDAGAVPSNAIDCLTAADGVDARVLVGALNASVCRALMELWGRDEAGMLQLMTYETATLPVPDVRRFSPAERSAVRAAADRLVDAPLDDDAAQAALDAAVLAPLDLDLDADRARALHRRLIERRVSGGEAAAAPVTRAADDD